MATATPFPAYRGDEPFVFVCYAHEDSDLVYRELSRLRQGGFNIWYDEGIEPGAEWSAEIAEHIEKCSVFLYFVTPASVEREYCRREINFALDRKRAILHVHVKPTEMPPALELNLNHRQAILRPEMSRKDYEAKLEQALNSALAVTRTLGPSSLRNKKPNRWTGIVAAGVSSLALFLILGLYSWPREDVPADDCDALTIAIMPFENLTGDSEDDFLGAFLREQVWQLLASLEGIGMISNTSSELLADKNPDARAVGEQLGVTYVVEGSYLTGERLTRVNVRLIDATTALEMWSEQFTGIVDNTDAAYELYSSIAGEITDNLPAAIGQQRIAGFFERLPTESLEVHRLIYQSGRQTQSGRGDPIATIDKALELDPESARALATKAIYLMTPGLYGQAEALARKAIRIDNHPTGYAALGVIQFYRDKDLQGAIENFRKALLFGEYAGVIGHMALEFFYHAGEWGAGLEAAERLLVLNPDNGAAQRHKARFLSRLRRDEEATATFDMALKRFPNNRGLVSDAFFHYFAAGDLTRAEQTAGLAPTVPAWPKMARAYLAAQRGDKQPLLERIEAWKLRNPPPDFLISSAYFQLGLFEEHLEWAPSMPEAIWALDESRRIPEYWEKLASWAKGDEAHSEMLTQFRQQIRSLETSLSFPIDPMEFVDEIYSEQFRCNAAI